MILLWILLIPVAGGVVAWVCGRTGGRAPRLVAIAALFLDLALVVSLWPVQPHTDGPWLSEVRLPWIPSLGMDFHLAADGVSLPLVALTCFLGIMAVAASWTEVRERVGFFHVNLLFTLTGIIGVFLALDLFLFYFFWELMLVPMYFLIAFWGHENRFPAAMKFAIFTQSGSLLMLAAIIGLYLQHGASTGSYTFALESLLATSLTKTLSLLFMFCFLAAFLVKLPAVPFHTWLPDAHTQAPTAGSVILAGLLLKTGAYGVFRFALPLFPSAASELLVPLGWLAVSGIVYGAILAFVQSDLKRLVAYTSVSHMGFVLLGLAAGNETALHGAFVEIVSHGLSTGALFVIAGLLQERTGTRQLARLGGLWSQTPRLGGLTLVFVLASLGLPGLGNFIGEFLILVGTYRWSPVLAVIASTGFVFSTMYSLRLMQKVFFGEEGEGRKIHDVTVREGLTMVFMLVPLIWLGIHPQPFFKMVAGGIRGAENQLAAQAQTTQGHHGVPNLKGPAK